MMKDEEFEKATAATELHMRGHSYEQIAERLGYEDKEAARKAVESMIWNAALGGEDG